MFFLSPAPRNVKAQSEKKYNYANEFSAKTAIVLCWCAKAEGDEEKLNLKLKIISLHFNSINPKVTHSEWFSVSLFSEGLGNWFHFKHERKSTTCRKAHKEIEIQMTRDFKSDASGLEWSGWWGKLRIGDGI